METKTSRQDTFAFRITLHAGPERFLDSFRTGRRPDYCLQSIAACAGLKIGNQTSAGFRFQLGDRVISGQRNRLKESVFVRIEVRWIPAEILREASHPAFGVMAEIGDQHTGCEVE